MKQKTEGTELPAMIGLLREHMDREEDRIRVEQQESYSRWCDEDRAAREERLLSGADSKWTQLQKSTNWHCRVNGGERAAAERSVPCVRAYPQPMKIACNSAGLGFEEAQWLRWRTRVQKRTPTCNPAHQT
jgi:hypothetical protein